MDCLLIFVAPKIKYKVMVFPPLYLFFLHFFMGKNKFFKLFNNGSNSKLGYSFLSFLPSSI